MTMNTVDTDATCKESLIEKSIELSITENLAMLSMKVGVTPGSLSPKMIHYRYLKVLNPYFSRILFPSIEVTTEMNDFADASFVVALTTAIG